MSQKKKKKKNEKSISMKNFFIAKRRLDSLEVPLRRKQILNLLKKRKEFSLVTPLENEDYEGTFLKIEEFNGSKWAMNQCTSNGCKL